MIRFHFDNALDYDTFSSYRNLVIQEMIDLNTLMNHPDTIGHVVHRVKSVKSENIGNGLAKSFASYLSPSYVGAEQFYKGIMNISTC